MPLSSKNTVPTSFTIDLSTIDRKIDKLLKYFTNCNIDIRDDGLRFVNFEVDYKSLEQSLRNKKYKQSLSVAVDKIYTERFINTRNTLAQNSLIGQNDFLLPQPLDDFGSKFDAFAATNTDPNNAILQILGVNPYKYLKIDIFSEQDLQTYNNNISAYYDVEKLSYILQKLENLTSGYVNGVLNEKVKTYIDQLNKEILTPEYNIQEMVPSIKRATEIFDVLSESVFNLSSDSFVFDTLSVVEPDIYSGLKKQPPQVYDTSVIDKAKIKILDFIIRNSILETLEDKISRVQNLDNFTSQYLGYNFYEQKFVSSNKDLSITKENIYFKLTFYRQPPEIILQQLENKTSDTKIEFNLVSSLKIQSPFGDPSIKNNKFVAVLSGADLATSAPIEFFEPTILSILSDIDFISNNIIEIDPFYCPTPESLQPTSIIRREEYIKNEVFFENIPKSKNFVDSNNFAFNYRTFPDLYFIPNLLMGPDAFFERINDPSMSRDKSLEIIRKNSKYYYTSELETPSAAISRDQNAKRLFENAAMKNGFYGLYETRKDSFADPALVEQIIGKIDNIKDNAVNQIQDIVFARTNIACLLKEFQTCFLPKVGNCRDVLRGFRFAELEEIVQKAFPESVYPTLFESIKIYKSNAIKDQKEKELLSEIENLEKQIEDSDRRKIIFDLLDQKIEPASALNRADLLQGVAGGATLKERYEQKLEEYRKLKQSQELIETQDIGTGPGFSEIDQFLDLLESNGIDIEILCDLARLITDLSQISFTFGTISLPELPSIDIFLETKASIDLAVVELIFQTVVAFIRNILEELLTCNGVKDLVRAGLTGETQNMGMAATTAAALNQVARGNFNLENFVENNPQVDPKEFNAALKNVGKSLANSVAIQQTTAIGIRQTTEIFGEASIGATSTTSMILSNPNSAAVTEQEIIVSLTGLIAQLSNVMDPLQFINLIGGKPSTDDLISVTEFIKQNNLGLSYLANITTVKNIFNHISMISGLSQVRDDLINVAATYSNLLVQTGRDRFCFDEAYPKDLSDLLDKTGGRPTKTPEEIEIENNRAKYRDLIKNLMKASPQELKSIVDEQIFKPALTGMLPNGKTSSAIDEGNKRRIKSALKPIADRFKSSSNSFYSKLALKKLVEREIPRFLKTKDEKGNDKEIENPEYKNQINMGGYEEDFDDDSIIVKEEKYVYGGVFTENFPNSLFDIDSKNEQLKISLSGKKGYTAKALQDLYSVLGTNMSVAGGRTSDGEWKIENIQKQRQNTIKIFEGETEKFSYDVKLQSTNDIGEVKSAKQKYDKSLRDSVYSKLKSPSTNFEKDFSDYTDDSYDKFLSSIYKKLSELVLQGDLLKSIENVPLDDFFNNVASGLSSSLGINLNIGVSPVGVTNPNIDTPLKYINFCPKPTAQQKLAGKDPSLYGLNELQNFVSQILSKRNAEILNLKTLQQMLEDDDNNLDLSLMDSLVVSLIRSSCADYLLRSIFVFHTFRFDKKLLDDLLLATYIAENAYNEITYFSRTFKKNSFLSITQEHIDYVHQYLFENEMQANSQQDMFADIKKIKNKISSLVEDRKILLSYKNRINQNSQDMQQDLFMEKIADYIRCLKDEIKYNKKTLSILQMRNIAQSEMITMLEKMSYLTSTNEKVASELQERCKKDVELARPDYLKTFIIDQLLKSDLYDVYNANTQNLLKLVELQTRKFSSENKIILERYVRVPKIKSQYRSAASIQQQYGLVGINNINSFRFFIDKIKTQSTNNPANINDLFEQDIKYGIRVVYIQENKPSERSLLNYDKNKSLSENLDKYFNSRKNKLYLINSEYDFKNNDNIYEKTYSVPYYVSEKETSDDVSKIGMVNCFPVVIEEIAIDKKQITTPDQLISLVEYLKSEETQVRYISETNIIEPASSEQIRLSKELRKKLQCNEKLSQFYDVLTNKNLLSNFMILSSINILNSKEMQTPFGSLRSHIMKDMLSKIQTIYNKKNEEAYEEMIELMSSSDFFKQFNYEAIIKTLIRAAIYVLQYYCQMTDPNISLAIMIRNAVKLALNAASQVGSSLGNTSIPAELPLPLSLLAPYSLGQLPITVFGVPPAGIGVGPPLTIPGMVLLGAELLLLNLEFAENIDKNTEDQKIKDLLKKYCFDLDGYKKYGV